ncbi:MAG: hypothetical protein H0T78_07385 [Longispora sp.]|nr:hypothetical protein [Longispora sp. (in: high G+C Gram-positive bacteria)]
MEMNRWIRTGLVAVATLTGVVVAAPMAQAVTGGDGTKTTAPNILQVLQPELLSCIVEQLSTGEDQVAASRVCSQMHAATQEPMARSIKVARTQKQLDNALFDTDLTTLVVIPAEKMTIATTPANPHAHIVINDTPSLRRHLVSVKADIRATVSGYANVDFCGSAQVIASDYASIGANDSVQVTASGNTIVNAYNSAQVTASGSAQVWAWGSTQIYAFDNVVVRTFDAATVTSSGPVTIYYPPFGNSVKVIADARVKMLFE